MNAYDFKPSDIPRLDPSDPKTSVAGPDCVGKRLHFNPWPYQENVEMSAAVELLLDALIEAGDTFGRVSPEDIRQRIPARLPSGAYRYWRKGFGGHERVPALDRLFYYGVVDVNDDGYAFTELGFRIFRWMLMPREQWDAWQQCGKDLYHAFVTTEGVPWRSRCGRHRAMGYREHKGGRPYCKDCNATTNHPQLMQQLVRMLGHENEWKDLSDSTPCSWCADDRDLGPARVVQTEAGLYVPETAVKPRREDQTYTPQNLLDGRPIAPKKEHEKP